MNNKICFLFGHGDCPDNILLRLEQAIENCYTKKNVRCFYVGNRGRFDALASTAVKRAKLQHRDIGLYLLLAYHPSERPVALPPGFDGTYYPPLEDVPRQFAIVRANQHMADSADYVICYVCHIGNARNLLEYVQRRQNVSIENVADNI